MRADRLGGVAGRYVEAEGKVELRTRGETVLADWLHYDFNLDEIWGKGGVVLRRGPDSISGTEAKFKRDTETGYFREPRFVIGSNGGRGSASMLEFNGPDRFEVTDGRYSTCVAPREDWYVRMDELEIDQKRRVGTGRNATVRFFDVPIAYTPWFEFPLDNERKTGFLVPTLGVTGIRGFEVAVPYYLNLAPNYDATLTPRLMTKRGLQLGGQGRYLFETFAGEIDAEILPHDRQTSTDRWGVSFRHNQDLAAITPGLAGFLNLNKVSDDTYFADLSDRIAVTSQSTLPREGGFTWARGPWQVLARAQTFQTLQDPNTEPVTPPYNRMPQLAGQLLETDWAGLSFDGARRVRAFPAIGTLPHGLADVRLSRRRVEPAGRGLVGDRPHGGPRAAVLARRIGARGPRSVGRRADRERRRRAGVRARLEGRRHVVRADARAARVLRVDPVPRPEPRCRISTAPRTTSTSPSSSASTAISATTASATRTR